MPTDRPSAAKERAERDFELVVPVRLPVGMTPEAFLARTRIEWREGGTTGAVMYRVGRPDLSAMPEFTGPKELRRGR